MGKSIIIIGDGMGGLTSGIYGQMNDYKTRIFEMHSLPGGQCAAWKRKGYTFDVCIHHLMGCSPDTRINEYVGAIKAFSKSDLWGEMMLGTAWDFIRKTPAMLSHGKWFKITMQQFAARFTDPFLRKAFPLLEYL